MTHSFSCEDTDWLCGIRSACKIFLNLESVLSFWMEPLIFRYLKV